MSLHLSASPSLLAAVLAPVAVVCAAFALQDPFEPELGRLGIQPPEVTQVLLPDSMPHQDKVGGNAQQLTALCGADDGGFAAVWRDQRDGSLGLYMARLGPDGAPLAAEHSVCVPHTMRRVDPSIVLDKDGSGAVTWTSVIGAGQTPWVHCFDAQGLFHGDEITATAVTDPSKVPAGRNARTDEDVNCRLPSIARLANGRYALAWTRAGHVQVCEAAASGEIAVPAADLKGSIDVEPGVLLATSGDVLVCTWETKKTSASTAVAAVRTASGAWSTQPLGDGAPQGLERDPAGGFWVLVAAGGHSVLRHVGRDARPDRADVVLEGAPVIAHQIAPYADGIAVLQEIGPSVGGEPAKGKPARGERAQHAQKRGSGGGTFLTLCDAAGKPRESAFEFFPAEARTPQNARVASNGHVLLVAWTDSRRGDTDVFGRIVDPSAKADARLGPDRRFNTDEASSDQLGGSVAASGDHGLVTWVDKREAPARVYARRFGAHGYDGDELALPLARAGETAAPLENGVARAEPAVRGNGDALVCFLHHVSRDTDRLVGQVIGLDGPRTGLIEIDAGKDGSAGEEGVVALEGDRGWFVAWSRGGGKGVWGQRIGADGALAGKPKRISDPAEWSEGDTDVALLDDGRLVVAWTAMPEGKPISIRARIVDDSGATRGDEMTFEHTRRGEDWDPSLAPAENNGFAMAWTAGGKTDGGRDVVVRTYDAQGHPKSPLATVCWMANEQDFSDLVRLPDKSFAVAWEDDVSYNDQVYVRRLSHDGRAMGTLMRFNGQETAFIPDRTAPRLAVLGDGIAATFGDRHRSLGFDVTLKVVGPKWDDVPPPPREGDKKR